MSCGCKELFRKKRTYERLREIAIKTAEKEAKIQLIIEWDGKKDVIAEECWIKGGRIGKAIEYFL